MSKIFVSCFFCEDFRKEADGRFSAMGIYSVLGQMDEYPHRVDRIHLVTYISVPKAIDRCRVSVELRHKGVTPDKRLRDSVSEELVRDGELAEHPYWQIINDFELGPLTFEESGHIEAVVSAGSSKSSCRLHYAEWADAKTEMVEAHPH